MAIFQPCYYVTIAAAFALLNAVACAPARADMPPAASYKAESVAGMQETASNEEAPNVPSATTPVAEAALPGGAANAETPNEEEAPPAPPSAAEEAPAENMDDPALVAAVKHAPALSDDALPDCPSDATRAKRTCYDGVFDSPVAGKACYSRKDDEGCRAAFQRCLQRCGYVAPAPAPKSDQAAGAPRENRMMTALDRRIREMTRRPSCSEDKQCGLYELKSPDGCSRFAPFSERGLNVRTLQQLVRSYNNAAALFFGNVTCPKNDATPPSVSCSLTPGTHAGECVISGQERP